LERAGERSAIRASASSRESEASAASLDRDAAGLRARWRALVAPERSAGRRRRSGAIARQCRPGRATIKRL